VRLSPEQRHTYGNETESKQPRKPPAHFYPFCYMNKWHPNSPDCDERSDSDKLLRGTEGPRIGLMNIGSSWVDHTTRLRY
jgi:hypothetical protein